VKEHLAANSLPFEKTTYKTIALEMREDIYEYSENRKEIDFNSMNQLIKVLNYAHDQGE
jgi:hypothetical protein